VRAAVTQYYLPQKKLLGRRLQLGRPLLDPALQVLREPADFFLGLFPPADVLDDGDEVLRLARRPAQQRHGQVDPDGRAVGAQVALLHRVGLGFARQQAAPVGEVGLQVLGVGGVLKGPR